MENLQHLENFFVAFTQIHQLLTIWYICNCILYLHTCTIIFLNHLRLSYRHHPPLPLSTSLCTS